jgi:integrase
VLAVHTGLRQGELFDLRWEDIDFGAGTLSVKRILSGAEGGRPVFGTPKTAKSRRSVKLTTQAAGALLRHREAQDRERATVWSGREDNHLVFRSTTGTPLNRHNLVRRSFKPLLERAGLPGIRFHDLRHTCATILLSKASTRSTSRRYSGTPPWPSPWTPTATSCPAWTTASQRPWRTPCPDRNCTGNCTGPGDEPGPYLFYRPFAGL